MTTCELCGRRIEGSGLTDAAFHPACLAERVPADLLVLLLGAALTVIAPAIVVWAG